VQVPPSPFASPLPPPPHPPQLSKEVTSLSQEISSLQAEIILFHQSSSLRSEQHASSQLQPVVQLSLGKTKLILLDSLWTESLSRTGFAVYGPVRKKEIEVNFSEEVTLPLCLSLSLPLSLSPTVTLCLSPPPPQFWHSLKNDLQMQNPNLSTSLASSLLPTEETTDPESSSSTKLLPPPPPCENILLISSTLLLPTLLSLPHQSTPVPSLEFDYLPSSALYLNTHLLSHKHRLLSLLSEWKANEQRRGCLLLSPLPNTLLEHAPSLSFCSEGWTHPPPPSPSSESDSEVPQSSGVSLRYVVLSSSRGRVSAPLPQFSSFSSQSLQLSSSPLLPSTPLTPTANLDNTAITLWKHLGHAACVAQLSSCHQSGYLTLAIPPQQPYTSRANHAIEEIDYRLHFHSSALHTIHHAHTTQFFPTPLVLTCGPIIGAVTSSSVRILCEVSLSSPHSPPPGGLSLSLFLIDCHTAQQHVCSLPLPSPTLSSSSSSSSSTRPLVFTFNSLSSQSLYLLYLDSMIQHSHTTALPDGPIGYFCTPSGLKDLSPPLSSVSMSPGAQLHLLNSGLQRYGQLTRQLKQRILLLRDGSNSGSNGGVATAALVETTTGLQQMLRQIFSEEFTERILHSTLLQTAKRVSERELSRGLPERGAGTGVMTLSTGGPRPMAGPVAVSSTQVTLTSQSKPYRRMSSLGVTGGNTSVGAVGSGTRGGGGGVGSAVGEEGELGEHGQHRLKNMVERLLALEEEELFFYFKTLPRLLVVCDVSSAASSAISAAPLSSTLDTILDHTELTSEIRELLSMPYSGLEVCVHIGDAVCLSQDGLAEVLRLLSEAERQEKVSRERLEESDGCRHAETLLRSLYREQWTKSRDQTGEFVHASHLFCFNDVLTTLLLTLRYSSLDQMRADYGEV
jgi:hypothetical protein